MAPRNFAQVCAKERASAHRQPTTRATGFVDLDRLGAFLRRAHPYDTAFKVAGRLGVPEGTARNWIEGRAAPNAANCIRIAGGYGPDALAAMFPRAVPDWLDSACRNARRDELIAERRRIDEELMRLTGDADA